MELFWAIMFGAALLGCYVKGYRHGRAAQVRETRKSLGYMDKER